MKKKKNLYKKKKNKIQLTWWNWFIVTWQNLRIAIAG